MSGKPGSINPAANSPVAGTMVTRPALRPELLQAVK